jgi:secreted trypsin-like serine protease
MWTGGDERQDTCGGGSGRPIFIPSSSWSDATDDMQLSGQALIGEQDVVVGITSWGPPVPCGTATWGAYTDVYYWIDWIRDTVDAHI